MVTLETIENDIKKDLLSYDSFLKLSNIESDIDQEEMIPDVPPVVETAWVPLAYACEYPFENEEA